jgi:hypothetical protein
LRKQRLHLRPTLWELLQVVSVASMEQVPLVELLNFSDTRKHADQFHNQLEINYS